MYKSKWVSVLSLLWIVGCGGGGGDGEENGAPKVSIPEVYTDYAITAIDGYLVGATAWLDTGASEISALTQAKGIATLQVPDSLDASLYPVYVQSHAGETFDQGFQQYVTQDFLMVAPPGQTVVTPFTTLLYLNTQTGIAIEKARSQLAAQMQIDADSLFGDFIASQNERMTLIAEDLVRLSLLPSSPSELDEQIKNPADITRELQNYSDIQSDPEQFVHVARNSSNVLERDTDGDKVADSDDPDIDGDGVPNEDDANPYNIDRHTSFRPTALTLSSPFSDSIEAGQWHYFVVETPEDILLNIGLSQLSGDVDLYVSQTAIPTKFDYDCRSNQSASVDETCLQRLQTGSRHFIALSALDNAEYQLTAKLDTIEIAKATLWLHGLASDSSTWKAIIDDDSFYAGKCQTLTWQESITTLPDFNDRKESCFSLDFGGFDRYGNLAPTGLDGKTCELTTGCNGDYSHFDSLGKEVEEAIGQIVDQFGIDTEVVLIGHSRGGLAARAYIQSVDSKFKEHVKALITTGTPHQGSPLGRFYKFMELHCIPQTVHDDDGGVCEDNWEVIKMMAGERWYFGKKILDLRAPGIDFLSPDAPSMTNLNSDVLPLDEVALAELTYSGTRFGILDTDVDIVGVYDLYDYGAFLGGDHPHPSTLRYVESGETRDNLVGDGIVPLASQKLSLILEQYGQTVDFSSNNNSLNVVHIDETKQVTDIFDTYMEVSDAIGWSNTK
ncbi:PGAP1-like alpha/beta domain-containing protein [Vibrio sp. 10N]|uniref:PGAP1-like alpha/beta domain-containing protein n=1 Tax=Vibrio sp. 10N TaxID=3058938 RepID=UPI002812BDCA|nr:hypothetical protein VB10N_44300 [Vibrio sp. 10N]